MFRKSFFALFACVLSMAFLSLVDWPSLTAREAQSNLKLQAKNALERATAFFHQKVAEHGGYVYRWSEDLSLREGEGIAESGTVWVQPPGTPAVGMAMLKAYEKTNQPSLLSAARDAAHCLVRGQLHSGGWQAQIDFSTERRARQAYRVDGPQKKKAKNISSFDDDKTQSALRFLMEYDRLTNFEDQAVHEAALFALDAILKNQHSNGGFGQVFESPSTIQKTTDGKARYPATWEREYSGKDYWWYLTLNDNNISRTIESLILASQIYGESRYRQSAIRAGEFLIAAQMPDPQPAWAQQYNFEMEPVWARKFEPPSISGGESQKVIETLMDLFDETREDRFLKPIPRALDYLKASERSDGKLARFYELQTNRPLYFTKDYQLTYEDNDLPTHYAFIIRSDVESLRQKYEKRIASKKPNQTKAESIKKPSDDEVRRTIESLDDRGAWVDKDGLRYHKAPNIQKVIKSETFIRNIEILSRYIAAD